MTDNQKVIITKMRASGCTYQEIGLALSIPEGTVKSFCVRNGVKAQKPEDCVERGICKECGSVIPNCRKNRIFCSNRCRQNYWRTHNGKEHNPVTIYHYVCEFCGEEFDTEGNKNQRFCSKNCAAKARKRSK